MKRMLIALLLLAILLVIVQYLPKEKLSKSSVEINGKVFSVFLAKTDQEKVKGLSIYESLPKDKGMIFVFQYPDYYAFWMKDMKFPIDIIYIREGRIVDIYKEVPNPTNKDDKLPIIKPRQKADTVLEINSGLSDKYNLKTGDQVKTNY